MSISRPSRIDGKDPATLTNQDLRQMKTNIFQSIEERKAIEIENDNEDDYRFRQWKAEQSTIVCAIDSELIARRREEGTKPKAPKQPVTEVTDAMVGHLAAKLLSDRILDGDTGDIDAAARESVLVATMTWTAILRVMAEDRKDVTQ